MRRSAIALAAFGLLSAVTAIAPATAQARDWHDGWHRSWHGDEWREHHDHPGAAVALGVLGGALARAAIASAPPYAPPPSYAPPPYYYPPSYYDGAPYGYQGYGYYR